MMLGNSLPSMMPAQSATVDPKQAQREALIRLLSQPAMQTPPLPPPAPPVPVESPVGAVATPGKVPPPGSAPRPFPLPSGAKRGRGGY